MRFYMRNKNNRSDTSVYDRLTRYLRVGVKIVFEGADLKPFDVFEIERMYAIIIDDRRIEMGQLFSSNTIQRDFPYYHRKYVLGQSR
jgi:hypothetical protein